MEELGLIAFRLNPHTANQMNIHEIVKSYDFRAQGSEQELTTSMAKALSNTLSFVVAGSTHNVFRQVANEQARNSVLELYQVLSRLKETQNEEQSQELDHLAVKILSFMALLNQKTDSPLQDVVPIGKELLEYRV